MADYDIGMARRLVADGTYLVLATADDAGEPWACPVWYAARDCAEFYWVSRPGARHSRNIAARPGISLVVFDPPEAVYAEAVAGEVPLADVPAGLTVYNGRSRERGLPEWGEERVTGTAQHRLFRARTTGLFVLDDHDQRVPVPVPDA
jgi:Pyridoxamine 5'-phosphate oxidase